MAASDANGQDGPDALGRKIDRHISPWKWASGFAVYFPLAQLLATLGSQNGGFVLIILFMQGLAGAALGALLALGARQVVKAIRC